METDSVLFVSKERAIEKLQERERAALDVLRAFAAVTREEDMLGAIAALSRWNDETTRTISEVFRKPWAREYYGAPIDFPARRDDDELVREIWNIVRYVELRVRRLGNLILTIRTAELEIMAVQEEAWHFVKAGHQLLARV